MQCLVHDAKALDHTALLFEGELGSDKHGRKYALSKLERGLMPSSSAVAQADLAGGQLLGRCGARGRRPAEAVAAALLQVAEARLALDSGVRTHEGRGRRKQRRQLEQHEALVFCGRCAG